MAKFRSLKNSFIAGQISSTAKGRTDLKQYAHACDTLKNAIPLPGGGAYRRPGTLFETEYSSSVYYAPRAFTFTYSRKESYNVTLAQLIGGAGVVDIKRVTSNASTATQATTTLTATQPYTSPNTNSSTGLYDETKDVQVAQSADVMWLVHPLYKPRKLHRTGQDTFRLTEFDYDSAGSVFTGTTRRDAWPYLAQNTTGYTINPTGTTGSIALQASGAVFTSTMVGSLIKILQGSTYGCAIITSFTSTVEVNATVIVDFLNTTSVTTWWESAWSDRRGWPRAASFYQGRLAMAGTTHNPDSIWFSQSSDYDQFSVDSIIDDRTYPTGAEPFRVELQSQQLNQIQWMIGGQTLVVGTIGDEWVVTKETDNSTTGFAQNNSQAYVVSRYGSAHVQAIRAGNEILFVTSSGDEVRALIFNDGERSYVAEPIQFLFDEYPKVEAAISGYVVTNSSRLIHQISWDETRKVLWCVDTVGNLFGITRDRTLAVSAWHIHEMGGYDSSITQTPPTISSYPAADPSYRSPTGAVLSASIATNPITGATDLWLVVKRKINGSFVYFLERMIGGMIRNDSAYTIPGGSLDTYHTDCSVATQIGDTSGAGSDSFSAGHLKGESLKGLAYGLSKGIFKVSFSPVDTTTGYATITGSKPPSFTTFAYSLMAGLPFSTRIVPVRVDAGAQIGTSIAAVQRVHRATLRFYNTIGCKIGSTDSNLETIIFRRASDFLGVSAELYTGEKTINLSSDYDRDYDVIIVQDDPLPFCLVSLVLEGVTQD